VTTEAPVLNGSSQVNRGLKRYAETMAWPRRQRQRVLGAGVDEDYCLTDFLFSLATKNTARLRFVYHAEFTKAPLGQTGGPSGGYLVPTDLQYELMQDVAEDSYIRPRASIVNMTSSLVNLPLPDAMTAQSAGTSPFFGGILMQWTQEGLTRPETEPASREVQLRAWDLTGYCLQSNTLYQDGGSGLETFLRKLFARSIAWYEDYAYLRGDGVGKPLGILNNPGTKVVTRQTTVTFTLQDLGGMAQALLPVSWSRAIWLISVSVWPKLINLNTNAFQLNQPYGEGAGRPHFILNGQPGFITEKLPAVGTSGDVMLVDPLLYVVGDRGAVEIATSFDEPTAFLKNQCVWRVTYRGDGKPWLNQLVTLQDASTTCAPYVVLSTL
jgi:HK97 family phage major capsid protein